MKDINDILAKHFSATQLSAEEQAIFNNWKTKNETEYISLEKSWQTISEFEYHEFNTEKAWQKIDSKLTNTKTKVFTLKPILKYAVAASVALLIAVGGYSLFGKTTANNFVAFENNTNKVKTLNLNDGTIIYLGKNSTIKYQNEFANNRNIKLNGEAFFDVYRDEKHPFVITTSYGDIEVLGTSFNINTNKQKTIVSVKSGRVELRNKLAKVILVKNESATSDGKSITNKTHVDANYLSWKTGKFSFKNESLVKVIERLNEFYDTKIKLSKNSNTNQPFTGEFTNQNIDVIVEAITLSCNLESVKQNNQIIIK